MKRRWSRFLRRRKRDEDMAREISSYIEHETADNIARGMAEVEARQAAIRKFGNRTIHREVAYEMSSILVADSIWRHIEYGVRQLRRTPGFTITAILSLALGIGANTAIFQLLDAVRLRSLPVQNPGELAEVVIDGGNRGFGMAPGPDVHATNPLWEQIRDRQQAFSGIFAWGVMNSQFGEAPRGRRIRTLYASGGIFTTLGVQPHRGRLFLEEDDRKGCPAGPAVISHRMWQSEFGGQESAIGARIVINEKPMQVVGVTPPEFFGLEVGRGFDVAIPNCARGAWSGILNQRHVWTLKVIGRLKDGWTMDRAAEYLKTASAAWFGEVVPTGYDSKAIEKWHRFRLTATPGGSGVSELRGQYERSLWLLLGVTGLVLLIACANLANLLLARAASREREMAVRMAIGATRGQIIGQLLTESLLLASAGAVFAAGLAQLLSQLLIQFLSTKGNTVLLDVPVDWRVLAFVTAVGLLTCLFFGLAPALKASRADAYSAMKSGGRGTTADRRQFSAQRILVACQIAISLMLVAGAFLFVRSFHNLLSIDAGFRQDGLVFNFIGFSAMRPAQAAIRPIQREMLDKVRAIPGIESASTTTHLPLNGGSWTIAVRVPGAEYKLNVAPQFTWVSPDYMKTMQIPLRAGRDINDGDAETTRKVLVVNERFVKEIFRGADPIGREILSIAEPGYPAETYEVVGVVADTKYSDLRQAPPPIAYAPEFQNPQFGPGMAVVVRSSIPTAQAMAALRRIITEGYPAANMDQVELRTMVSERLLRERLLAWVSGFFGLLAIGLATIGLYGVVSHMATRRENEIGIRMAMGADRRDVVGLLLRDVAALFAIGVPVGIIGSLALTRGVSTLLYGIEPSDPLALGLAAAALTITGIVATLIPSARASRLDPVKCLRAD